MIKNTSAVFGPLSDAARAGDDPIARAGSQTTPPPALQQNYTYRRLCWNVAVVMRITKGFLAAFACLLDAAGGGRLYIAALKNAFGELYRSKFIGSTSAVSSFCASC